MTLCRSRHRMRLVHPAEQVKVHESEIAVAAVKVCVISPKERQQRSANEEDRVVENKTLPRYRSERAGDVPWGALCQATPRGNANAHRRRL